MNSKKTFFTVIALVALVAIMAGIWIFVRPKVQQGAKTITVTVVHSDGDTKEVTYHTDEEYLGALLVAEGLITGHNDKYGMVIETVDGEEAVWEKNGAYWAIYVNDEYGMVGVDKQTIADGDHFKLVFTVG